MIVMAIIGVLASIAAPTLINYRTKAKNALAASEIRLIEKEIKMYQIENMRLPDRLGEVKLGNISDPWGNPYQYLKIAQEDQAEKDNGKGKGNGNGNRNDSTEQENPADDEKIKPRKDHFLVPVNSDFDLYSMGADGKSKPPFTAAASYDDIVRASDGKYVGLVSQF
jgi:general secretion pathway protein G